MAERYPNPLLDKPPNQCLSTLEFRRYRDDGDAGPAAIDLAQNRLRLIARRQVEMFAWLCPFVLGTDEVALEMGSENPGAICSWPFSDGANAFEHSPERCCRACHRGRAERRDAIS